MAYGSSYCSLEAIIPTNKTTINGLSSLICLKGLQLKRWTKLNFKRPWSLCDLFFLFCFNRTCHIPIPQRPHTHRWMKTNKTFQKSLWSPLARAVSLSRQEKRPSLYLKGGRGDSARDGRNGGGGGLVVMMWRRGHCAGKGKSSNEGRKFYVVWLPSLAIRWCYLQRL